MSEVKKTEAKTKDVKKVETKKINKKTSKKDNKEKVVVTKPGGGISMKNWIIMIVVGFILFLAGFYFGQLSTSGTIKNYELQIKQLEEKQNIIQEVLDTNF